MNLLRAVLCTSLILVACTPEDLAAPSVAIIAPASGSVASGTMTVQVSAVDDVGLQAVQLYVRGKGSVPRGQLVGAAVEEPYVVNWYTPAQPNLAELELLALARDIGGSETESLPVAVRTHNSGVPLLERLYAFTLPPQVNGLDRGSGSVVPDVAPTSGALPPPSTAVAESALSARTQASLSVTRDFAIEWQLYPFVGADGYGLYVGIDDIAGPYDLMGRYSAGVGAGSQQYSLFLDSVAPGTRCTAWRRP